MCGIALRLFSRENSIYSAYPYITSSSRSDTNWVYANGLIIASIENGRISVDDASSEKMKSIVDKMYSLIMQGKQTLISQNKADIQDIRPFINGRTLFMENITLPPG